VRFPALDSQADRTELCRVWIPCPLPSSMLSFSHIVRRRRTISRHITVIGGGLAGSEAAWQAAQRGVTVDLYEMRPIVQTAAHQTGDLAELVCSNSLGSNLPDRAPGMLKNELRALGSVIIRCADDHSVPAGMALAVGREAFSRAVSEAVSSHPLISLHRQHMSELPSTGIVVLASGPLTSSALAASITELAGQEQLYFYDAMAPIVSHDSIDGNRVFRASRYDRGDADYINCPMNQAEYDMFVNELIHAETIPLRDFEHEDKRFFEACLPVEVLAARGPMSLAYGPLKPKGLVDPSTGRRPYAVVQLRQDDAAGSLYNMVGFQTNLRWGEQRRVFSLIPGLDRAEWVRFGQMHRNTFIDSPDLLENTLQWRSRPGLFVGGQISGTEGYVASAASGLLAGLNAARSASGNDLLLPPDTTMIGALVRYVTTPQSNFQPMKPNFGLMPPLEPHVRSKRARYSAFAKRSSQDLERFIIDKGVRDDMVA